MSAEKLDRNDEMLALLEQGIPLRAIAARMGLSRSRVGHCIASAASRRTLPERYPLLAELLALQGDKDGRAMRAYNCLINTWSEGAGWEHHLERRDAFPRLPTRDVAAWVFDNYSRRSLLLIPNLGRGTAHLIEAWLATKHGMKLAEM